MTIHALGPFRLDTHDGLLLRGGEPVTLGRRAIALLRALVEQPGALLSKDALIEAGWPGQSVEESNLTVQIAALRRIFSTIPGGDRWIETMPRRGYQFIGPVVTEAQKETPEKSTPPRLSIVVLPFANIGGDLEQEHFVDGITESLTSDLWRIRGAFVIARNTAFTYKGKPADAKQIGRELSVRYVLEGSVQREGKRMRVNVQLIDAETSNHLWAERFDKPLADLFDMQDEIVARLANALDAQLTVAEARHTEPGEVERERALEPPLPATRSLDEGEGRGPEWRYIAALAAELVPEAGGRMPSDPEDLNVIIAGFRHQAATVVTQYGGVIGERRGCEIVAYFGFPHAQENDGERAVRAALAIQRALLDLNARNAATGAPELAARIGLESGRVMVNSSGEVYGEAPIVAAQVQSAAAPGEVWITLGVHRQIAGQFVAEDKGEHELKGVPEKTQLYSIVRVSGGGRRGGSRAPTPLVGRAEELDILTRRWERARRGEGQLWLITGEPGLGKSRLIEEFRARLVETPHTWVEWASSQLLQNTPLHPVAEWGRARFGGDQVDGGKRLAELEAALASVGLDAAEYSALLAPIIGAPLPPERIPKLSPEELRSRQLAALAAWVLAGARAQRLVLAFEDLHWADPTSLDVLRALAERGAQAPLLILATTRPDFRPPWKPRSHHGVISLAPLDPGEIVRMVGEIAVRHALSNDVIEGISERSGGVPLFIEEVTRLLLERGEAGGAQAIPPTLQQSLAARLDRLGPAREIAQIGAVLGRVFSHALLQAVAGLDEPALRAALDRLADAELLFVEGAAPHANYRFKHALIQDAAYDSLLKSRRQTLHRRAAEVLLASPAPEAEALAHHFTQAGQTDLAIEWWGKAGDHAMRRSAFVEAISHLGKAIALSDKAGGVARPRVAAVSISASRLKLQTSYGQAVMWTKGFTAEETKVAFARIEELATEVGDAEAPLDACYARWVHSIWRGEFGSAREAAESFLRVAERAARPTEAAVGHRILGWTRLLQGDLEEARTHCEQTLRIYDPERDREAKFRFGQDSAVAATGLLALAAWRLGAVERARELMDEAVAHAVETAHVPTLASRYSGQGLLEMLRDDAVAGRRAAEAAVALGREHGLTLYRALAELNLAWARAKLGDRNADPTELRQAVEAYASQGNKLQLPFYQGLLAEIEAERGEAEAALAGIDDALALAGETGEHWFDAGLHRIRGEILLKQNAADPADVEAAFLAAIAVAQQQKARSFELRAALSLAKLYQSTGRSNEAHDVLGPALEGFSPTPEFAQIAEAKALFEALAHL